ncbi:hypothetical protein GPECTOR_26g527 [Gonium pectorale]|uniref:Uncharacterized protein n=1 Tax=Gonium pectorale TaxID=33097 RepID=A0A150GFM8_GONPE|nr:hypothetical protein GPECTOR_26g527 [Gonium pectorale]|eukprot:KXZ48624.1 hypothetical protein GPECTOR_26g527 [Gonium pectorale]
MRRRRWSAREAAHQPDPSSPRDSGKESLYAKLLDPNSDFPEPALQGDHLKAAMRDWLPSAPTSPSSRRHHKKKGGTAATASASAGGGGGGGGGDEARGADAAAEAGGSGGGGGGKRLPVAGVRGGVEARDAPNEVNQDVGEFLATTVSPHGHAHTARGVASGFGDAAT